MIIKYNMDNRSYYLRDLGDGSGTFVRLDVPLVLNLNDILDTQAWVYNIFWRFSYGGLTIQSL